MTDPKRWLDSDGDAPLGAARLLSAGRNMDPPEGAEQAVWLVIAAKIAVGGAAAGAAGSGAASAGASGAGAAAATATSAGGAGLLASILPSVIAGAIGGLIAVGSYSAIETRSPDAANDSGRAETPHAIEAPAPTTSTGARIAESPRSEGDSAMFPAGARGATAPAATTDPTSAPASGAGAGEPAPSATNVSVPSDPGDRRATESSGSGAASGGSPVIAGSPEERASQLREEAAMVADARATLRSGNAAEALRRLEAIRQKFPGGMLGQEREALAIEALAKSGAVDVASARAKDFIARHPTSPHAARLQAFVR